MSIFKDGYLQEEFTNPNYRGLVGWDCELVYVNTWTEEQIVLGSGVLISKYNKSANIAGDIVGREIKSFKIKQFTASDITVGELCWVGGENEYYALTPFSHTIDLDSDRPY